MKLDSISHQSTFDSGSMSADTKLKVMFVHNRIMYGHVGQFFIDMVKTGAHAVIPDGTKNNEGSHNYRPKTAQEVIAHSVEVTELMYETMKSKGWSSEAPTFDTLVEDTGNAGFMRRD